MNKELILNLFTQIIKQGNILIDEPMKKHTSFKIGGPVDFLITPGNMDEVYKSVKLCRDNNIDYMIIGNGSNLLVKDGGIRGVVIKIADKLNNIVIDEDRMIVEAGALLSTISKTALKNSLAGLEFASGIPGTIGGAMTMNAGAYGGEMKDITEKVKCIDRHGDIIELNNEEMNFGYRKSRVEEENLIVLEVEIKLRKSNYEDVKMHMDELNKKRTTKQPLNLPSGGSTFKRPTGYFAAKLIEDCGLKGVTHGGAQVSDKHAGFIVNIDKATSKDVLNLIETVKKVVRDKFKVDLETEVKIVGED
ncbi:UDP-N-acetylenolpyruvoylglucosamine reductase MurB [Gottschalkia acidurici 9a]|uniref:UDP-N-acetylenolpyruvoylglucosamine reductase n=1 Tax=Gottschalkia acidurici (strain ATCC 7906 / DSM 604 / BCRC 14475 / CIP 104303 / KCTC 5404 / NCIMB 10678 / 9a) TaxID=1128398 RepID=K0AZ02_GOTA9|nr:UDP-N-acetylmuramate dehydrogenase [Gottschalkia acidurici]AFS79033.1 UDP-N-acetylenolpyruvoylglucosamine reductase MurB [Gottschalkia acidurici 9a]